MCDAGAAGWMWRKVTSARLTGLAFAYKKRDKNVKKSRSQTLHDVCRWRSGFSPPCLLVSLLRAGVTYGDIARSPGYGVWRYAGGLLLLCRSLSVSGRGSFVAGTDSGQAQRIRELTEQLKPLLEELKALGYTQQSLEALWEGENDHA